MDHLYIALSAFGNPWIILAALGGVTWGVIGGALPGISASITMALLLPFTYGMDPLIAIILLASTYVGAEYGGSIPAILIRTPGNAGAAATTLDGHEMHRQGRGGEALGISLCAGVVGGLIGMIMVVLLTAPLAKLALLFTAPAYCALGILGLSIIASVSEKSLVKGLLAGLLGLALSTVGVDPVTGQNRFTFGSIDLIGGIKPIIILMGVFAVAELLEQAGVPAWEKTSAKTRIVFPSWKMWKRLAPSMGIGSFLGTIEGITPGGGGSIAAFLSYNEAKRWSKHKEEFGKGSPEGVAGPEAANNTVAAAALIPTLSFGIPGSSSMAVLLAGLFLHGLEPGPMLFVRQPDFVYGLYGGLFLANISQLLVGIVILTPCIWLVNRPKPYLLAAIFSLVMSGVYSINFSTVDMFIVLGMGVVGFFMRRTGFPVLPLVLGVVLGHMVERYFRFSMELSRDDLSIFVRDPISAGILAVAFSFVAYSLWRSWRDSRAVKAEEARTSS